MSVAYQTGHITEDLIGNVLVYKLKSEHRGKNLFCIKNIQFILFLVLMNNFKTVPKYFIYFCNNLIHSTVVNQISELLNSCGLNIL